MTIDEVIAQVDAVKPNTYSREEKIRWLSKVDGVIKKEIIDTHEGGEQVLFVGYDENTPLDTELIAKAPHDDLYRFWLEAQIDYANSEMGKYNNSITTFNTAYGAYARHYNRNHLHKATQIKYF